MRHNVRNRIMPKAIIAKAVSGANKTTEEQRRRLRIAYLSMTDSYDRTAWSGTQFYMAQALEKYFDLLTIGALLPVSLTTGKWLARGVKVLTGRRYLYMYTTSFSKTLGRMAEKGINGQQYDVVFAPAGSGILAHLHAKAPIIYLSDTTFRLMAGYNVDFSNAFASHVQMADEIERLAIRRASHLVYPSSWAAKSAVDDYGADPTRVHVVPFGANLDAPPSREDAIRRIERDRCHLLFVGVKWVEKGGEIAFRTLLELERLGIPAELNIVGCTPPKEFVHPNLHVFPFLNKNDESEREQLNRLYREATFFILPTRAECFGVAFCEANAFGLPVLSTETGGVPEVVRNGVNGFLFPLEARGDQYAARIRELWETPSVYQALRVSSRQEFESRLNWDAWAVQVGEVLWSAVESQQKPPRHLDRTVELAEVNAG